MKNSIPWLKTATYAWIEHYLDFSICLVPWDTSLSKYGWQNSMHKETKWPQGCSKCYMLNTLRPRQTCHCFVDGSFKSICFNENVFFLISISLQLILNGSMKNKPLFVQITAKHWTGDSRYLNPWGLLCCHISPSIYKTKNPDGITDWYCPFSVHGSHCEDSLAFTRPRVNLGLISLILNMIIHRRFTRINDNVHMNI